MSEPAKTPWTFLTNHAVVLLCIARDPGIRLRDVAERVGITERAVQRIVAELDEDGYISKRRVGRRNVYEIKEKRHLRHPLADHQDVGELLNILTTE